MRRYDQIDDVHHLQHLLDTAEAYERRYRHRSSRDPLVQSMRDDNDDEIVALRGRLAQLGVAGRPPDDGHE